MSNILKIIVLKPVFTFLTGLWLIFSLSGYAQDQVSQVNFWQVMSQPIYKSAQQKEIAGNGWAIITKNEQLQFSFKINVSKDVQFGQWSGDIRSMDDLSDFKLIFTDRDDQSHRLVIDKLRRLGSIPVAQDSGESKTIFIFGFLVSWDQILLLKNAKSLVLEYRTADQPKLVKLSTISLAGFSGKLDELVSSIKAKQGAAFYVYSQNKIDEIKISELPASIRKTIYDRLKSQLVAGLGKVEIHDSEVEDKSYNQVVELIKQKKKKWVADKQKAYQAIYDQEPKWLDMNMCPSSDVKYCRYLGRQGHDKHSMLGMEAYNYGSIRGVVWRSKNSIIKINGGSIDMGIEPEIVRASSAGYYYLFTNDAGRVNYVISVDAILVK